MLRVLLAERFPIIRAATRNIIEHHLGWAVCAEAEDGRAALDLAVTEQPDVAVIGMSLTALNGVGLARRLREESPRTAVLLFSARDDQEAVSGALAAGARGYVLKSDAGHNLEAAIGALGANRTYFSSTITELLLDVAMHGPKAHAFERFTTRELEVAELVAGGNGNKQISRSLGIAIKTVESHRAAGMRKAGVRTAAQFVRFALKNKLIAA